MGCLSIVGKEYREFSQSLHSKAWEQANVVNAQIELTYGCNLKCVHCYTDCYNRRDLIKERELPYEDVIRILDELHKQGVLWICFTGGEIFMREDFFEIYRYAKDKGFLITLFTNVTLITEKIADFLAEHRPFQISTSCHGATPETFDKVTQVNGSFQRFKEGIRRLLERQLPVKIKTKAMTLNKHELEQIKAFVESLDLKFHVSTAIYPRLNGNLDPVQYRLSPDEIVELEFSESDAQDEDFTCQFPQEAKLRSLPDERVFRCGCGTTAVHISAWGELGTCTWVKDPVADLRKNSVAAGIGAVFPRIRSAHYENETPCRSCQIYSLCNKMPANAAAEAGNREEPVRHFCDVAHLRARRLGVLAERGQITSQNGK